MDYLVVLAIVFLFVAWRMLPAFVEGFRGGRGGFFAAVGSALARKLRR